MEATATYRYRSWLEAQCGRFLVSQDACGRLSGTCDMCLAGDIPHPVPDPLDYLVMPNCYMPGASAYQVSC